MKRRDRLDTFVPPRPSPGLMGALAPVNRVLCLAGTPGLRAIPGLNRIPGIRGLSDVVDIDLPRTDEDRLLMAVNRTTAAFITPNHPEFFTDWMLDKELSARIAPLMASWATHDVVNGMGALAQWFWLKNNLVAQIPGTGGAAGREYSVEWALQGHGVLLHPEGGVGWHADHVAPLFPGVVDMAMQAVAAPARAGIDRIASSPLTPALSREGRGGTHLGLSVWCAFSGVEGRKRTFTFALSRKCESHRHGSYAVNDPT